MDFGVELQRLLRRCGASPCRWARLRRSVEKLLRVTRESLDHAIEKVRPGNRLGDVSAAVQQWVEKNGFSVVREFVGHGIGTQMHEEPQRAELRRSPASGPRLQEGMVLAIEPMVNAGGPGVRVLDDEWTAVTDRRQRFGSFRAHRRGHRERAVDFDAARGKLPGRPGSVAGDRSVGIS